MSRFLSDVGLTQKPYGYEETLSVFLGSFGIQFSPVAVSGDVADAGLYNVSDMTPVTTEAVTYSAGGTPVSDTYAGITLRTLLDAAGGVDVTSAKNHILSKFVVATGADGCKAAFSLGEIDPEFGDQPVLVATPDTAGQLGPKGSEGLVRMVVPGDHAGGRYVSDLVDLRVGSLPEPPSQGLGGVSDQFALSGQVADPATFTPVILAALNQTTTETASFLSGAGQVTDTYIGVSLWTLLQDQGLVTDPAIRTTCCASAWPWLAPSQPEATRLSPTRSQSSARTTRRPHGRSWTSSPDRRRAACSPGPASG